MEIAHTRRGTLTVDPSLAHLQAELARIDLAIHKAIRRWQIAGQDPADAFRGLTIQEGEANTLLARPMGSNWGDSVNLPDAEARDLAAAEAWVVRQAKQRAAEARRRDRQLPRLEHLATAFELD